MKINSRLYLRKNRVKKDGKSPVCLSLMIDRRSTLVSLNVFVAAENWDEKNLRVKRKQPDSKKLNMLLSKYERRAQEIIFEFEIADKPLTFEDFKAAFFNEKFNSSSFYDFVLENLAEYTSWETLKHYNTEVTKLKKFRKQLYFSDITTSFLSNYEAYMRNDLCNRTNTIHKSLKFIRTFINKARRQGIIEDYVFSNYTLRLETTYREFLLPEELKKVEQLKGSKELSESCNSVLNYFLFSCYTGLRFNDVESLRYKHIVDDTIKIRMHKTNEPVSIPLIKKAKDIALTGKPNEKIFKMHANQVTNRIIKRLMKLAGIKKNISFHCARHSFATIGITLKIPIEVISKLLGHKDIKTTMIYARIVDEVKRDEMNKWDDL